ncbi:phage tail tape measure C-terminal domain-containing protein [Magnetococcus sp. PR-3]|uniref:phage tail tape measure C-terminal domain-containing protein n=1 Tax=Magnetococcus sp. PR-3 TaxID=3120355 RepID=UPI002FCE4E04
MATKAELGQLVIELSADVARLQKDLGKASRVANKELKTISKAAKFTSDSLKTLALAGTGMVTTGWVKGLVDAGDKLQKMSIRLGVSTNALSEFQRVAEYAGVEQNQLVTGWQRMTRRVSEAAAGTGAAKDALVELGLEAKTINQLAPDQQFMKITEALQGVSNQADKVRLANKLFDTEGVGLLQMMDMGVDGIDQMRQKMRDLGLSMDRTSADSMAEFNDQLGDIGNAVSGIGTSLTLWLTESGVFKEFSGWFVESAVNIQNWLVATNKVQRELDEMTLGQLEKRLELLDNKLGKVDFQLDMGGESDPWADQFNASKPDHKSPFAQTIEALKKDRATIEEQIKLIQSKLKGGGMKLHVGKDAEIPASPDKATPAPQVIKDPEGWQSLYDSIFPMDQAMREYEKGLDAVNTMLARNKITSAQAAQMAEHLGEQYANQLEELIGLDALLESSNEKLTMQGQVVEGVSQGIESYLDSMGDTMDNVAQMTERAFSSMEDSLVDFVMNGKIEFSGFVDSILADMARMVARNTITEPLGGLLSGGLGHLFKGSGGWGDIGDFPDWMGDASIGDWSDGFWSARAIGGPVATGQSYLVGEHGPELFTPVSAGNITPNKQLGGGGTINLNLSTGVKDTVRAELISMMPMLERRLMGAMADAAQRGGGFSAAMRGA